METKQLAEQQLASLEGLGDEQLVTVKVGMIRQICQSLNLPKSLVADKPKPAENTAP